MLTDEDLAQIRKMVLEAAADAMTEALKTHFTKKKATSNAERQRRYRATHSNAGSNAKVTRARVKKSNADSNAAVTPSSDAVAFIPFLGDGEFGVSKALLAELEAAYPMVDGPQTLKEIRAWCITNPTQCKTARGTPRFINSWFRRVQDRG